MYEPDKDHYGPLYQIIEVFQKYSSLNILDHVLKSDDIMHIDRFKDMVKEKIKVYENNMHAIFVNTSLQCLYG